MSLTVTRTPARVVEQVDMLIGPVAVGITEGATVDDPMRLSLAKADFYKFAENVPLDDLKQLGQEIVDYCNRVEANREPAQG